MLRQMRLFLFDRTHGNEAFGFAVLSRAPLEACVGISNELDAHFNDTQWFFGLQQIHGPESSMGDVGRRSRTWLRMQW